METFEPDTTQLHVLLRLFFTGEEPLVSKVQPKLQIQQRQQLVDAGLIELIPLKGQSKKIALTDKAWVWFSEHLTMSIPTRLKLSSGAVEGLLHKINDFLTVNDLTLIDIMNAKSIPISPVEPQRDERSETMEDTNWTRIRNTYLHLSDGEWNSRVRLSDLRKALPDIPKQVFESCLIQKQDEGKLVLYQLDDPSEIREDDIECAIDVSGFKRHIVYME